MAVSFVTREDVMNERARTLREQLIRNIDELPKERESRPPLYDTLCGRLGTGTAARALGISVDIVAPGMRGCPYHLHHAQEEAFVVLEGRGALRVAGEMLELKAGDVAFLPAGPDYPHQIVNTSDAPLKYLSISTQERPEIVEYPDSDKVLAMSGPPGKPAFARMSRRGEDLDYWAGEP
ncbi:MAG TPA: cupin domain-containing protein [Caldimonas sp.]|nr:cupin domain-containing protein [Caldimonas sp.]HEX4234752.1 cupin domain-containing protein [Caldimonas sp.]